MITNFFLLIFTLSTFFQKLISFKREMKFRRMVV